MTAYQSKYLAHALTLANSSATLEGLSRSIANARVDMNPHQVDAALFAIRSPLSKGAILADEVGLGKTIEAGLVLSQRWAERKRRILLILPATLRKQWQQELEDKFFIPSVVLETKNFNRMRKDGHPNPFNQDNKVVLCSYHFAANKAEELQRVPWDLVVIDEAHRLRNVYKTGNKIARAITDATRNANKILLTATPLQNSLMELYGLVSVIDPHLFGDKRSFSEQYARRGTGEAAFSELKERLRPVCQRTLRKQVLEYIRFTQRIPITQEFLPTDEEQQLYDDVSTYLQRAVLVALPSGQRSLMTMVLRKLLASSTFAIAGTLRGLVSKLEGIAQESAPVKEDFETLDEVRDEWDESNGDDGGETQANLHLLQDEIAMLREYADLAESIAHNAKGTALLDALQTAFAKTNELGAAQKAVIFTESKRTQEYLFQLLSESGYADKIVILNGSNTDPKSKEIYEAWQERNPGRVSGSKVVDIKAAIVDAFRNSSDILIATEAAAEGVNLQFCSLVVNYDLPWNPQRIEQRIGRCHRYGQKHDVVVVNFLNRRNAADVRVFQLLSEKFRLFDGVFGASDEVLGALESGVDIEKRIAKVFQECRTADDIGTAFDALQAEVEEQIASRMAETREVLLDHFDEEVHARLKIHQDQAQATLSEMERRLLSLARMELGQHARFDSEAPRFQYSGPLVGVVKISTDVPDGKQKTVTVPPVIDQIIEGVGTVPTPAPAPPTTALAPATPSSPPAAPTFIKTDADRAVARKALEVIQRHERLPSARELSSAEVTKKLVEEVQTELAPAQMTLPDTEEQPDVAHVVAETVALYIARTIDIPRIVVLPKGEVSSGYEDFDLDTTNVRLQPVKRDILIQALGSGAREKLEALESGGEEERLEDYLVRALIDYDDISYDHHAGLLYKLSGQMVTHLRSYLANDDEVRNVLLYNQQMLGKLIHAQMSEHYWERAAGYEATVTRGFTTPKQNAYSASADQPVHNVQTPVDDRQNIRRMLFDGFRKCLYPVQKFDSDSERRFAAICESDTEVEKWFKPARNDFQIYFRADEAYEPDFVVESKTTKYLCEPKRADQMEDATVQAKAKAAAKWCKHATVHEQKHGGKPWQYLLIPHDAISSNKTMQGLAAMFSRQCDD